MSLTPEMTAALAAKRAKLFGALKVELPGHTIRLLDGSAELIIGGEKFAGIDPVYGTVSLGENFSDGDPGTAPHLTLTFYPPNGTAAAELSSAAFQGSTVTLTAGAVYRATGQVVPDPFVLFVGELDTSMITISRGKRAVPCEIVSAMERCFEQDEGARLNDGFHQSIFPGELGLSLVVVDPTSLPWGAEGGRPAISTSGGVSATDRATTLLRQAGYIR